ncbi:MAG: hypothetical protein K8F90_01650 [Hyphomicrobiales bacterium]|nr:hypothetical protein [Hyphomicrobiales bacterium]
MQRLNLSWFSQLALALQPLTLGGLEEPGTGIQNLARAWSYLGFLGDAKRLSLSLAASRPLIWQIQEECRKVFQADAESQPEALLAVKDSIYQLTGKLNALLDADLAHQSVYNVLPKRAYDIDMLISDATQLFADPVRGEFNEEEKWNIEQAGKCLAFEVPTAAAFHIWRTLDSVLQRYVVQVAGKLPRSRNWGAYIKVLEDAKADIKITSVLTQIKDLYRNPIVHPEERLDNDRALSLIGIAESAIGSVIADMVTRRGP